ncbi:MAG: hypothetical protein ACXVEF_39295 [Polyangiales bacterium]
MDFREQLEAEAVANNDRAVVRRLDRDIDRRKSVRRQFGGGRGATWWAFIQGRVLTFRDVREPEARELTLEELVERGLPASSAEIAGEQAAAMIESARALVDLPCMCGTGAETPEQHGTIWTMVSRADFSAPIDCTVTVGRCKVCGRGWTFEAAGDSMYSYHYRVERFPAIDG